MFDQNLAKDEHKIEESKVRPPSSTRAMGEQIINNTATIKSKSIGGAHSQMGGQDSETVRRMQEALQTKKEVITELNEKLLNLQSEHDIKIKK